ncbi:hypothetical protein PZE06_24720 [Robertmurraya sp. DFI.2.37]|uniref:hypothetical protein n=1 Tax=Robertmurraya sp. DFI.2.37 TaxID=3031819 RepID=UPI001CD9E1AB|nr:hypothetical protein [Robertmurraya sp. DFI.2.37]MDF1511325.1 hypothetical protein [Robertmurraya sp. DFI.2.37]
MNYLMNLFNIGSRPNRRNNRGILRATLIGLGFSSAAVFGLRRNGNTNILAPIQNMANNVRNNGQMKRMATAVTEFSKELVPNQIQGKNK